jgi:hypothetical protein
MTKRYARFATAQVRQAVQGLDSIFKNMPEPKSNFRWSTAGENRRGRERKKCFEIWASPTGFEPVLPAVKGRSISRSRSKYKAAVAHECSVRSRGESKEHMAVVVPPLYRESLDHFGAGVFHFSFTH